MFEFIGNLLRNIADFFTSIWEVIINVISDIVAMVKLLAQAISTVPGFFRWMPAGVITLLGVILSVVVIYKLLGREG